MRHLIFLFFAVSAAAQSVGDFSIPYKASSTGPQTLKTWAKVNSTLWGTDPSGNPQSIALASGLSLSAGVLSGPDLSGYQLLISDGDLTIARTAGLQTALDGKQPMSDNLNTLAAGFGAIATGLVKWNGASGFVLLSSGLPTNSGGTGQTAYTTGDLLYGSAGTLAVLAGNTTTTKKFLAQTGTGLGSAAPIWSTIATSDLVGTISNAQLANSSITINGSAVSLGGSTTISTGLTIGTTTTSGAASGDIITSDGTNAQKLTPGTGVSTALANAVNAASGLLTYGIIGTSGTKLPLLNTANTWSAAQAFTSTLAADSSAGYPQFTATGYTGNGVRVVYDRIDFWIGGSPQLTILSGSFNLSTTACSWGNNTQLYGGSDSTGRLVQRVGTNPQAFSVANTYTSYTNKEEVELGWTSNVAHLWTIKGSGGGSARALAIGYDAIEKMRVSSSGVTIGTNGTAIAQIKRYSVTLVAGTATISDTDITATTAVIMSVITPGGTVGTLDYDVSAGSSFTVNSSSATDTSNITATVIIY